MAVYGGSQDPIPRAVELCGMGAGAERNGGGGLKISNEQWAAFTFAETVGHDAGMFVPHYNVAVGLLGLSPFAARCRLCVLNAGSDNISLRVGARRTMRT